MSKAPSMYLNLSDQTQFRLNKINKIKGHFIAKNRKSKRISKYIAAFDYFGKALIILFA